MKDYSKFTPHRDPTGNAAGYKENLIKIAGAGHQIRAMSADQYGVCFEAFQVADDYNGEALAVYRPTEEGQQGNSKKWNYGQSYPWNTVGHNYTMDVDTAAQNHIWAYGETLKQIPEWDGRTWFLFFNEIDHERLEYCAAVALIMAQHAIDNNLKFAFFGINSGEPEAEQWQEPNMKALLQLMAAHPANVALCLHEYSFDVDIMNGYGYKVGRFLHLVDACKVMGIPFGNIRVFITEGGHGKDMTLSPSNWDSTIDTLAAVYGDYPNIQMCALWCISSASNWGGEDLSKVVRESFNYSAELSTGYEPIVATFDNEEIPPVPEQKHKAIILKAPQPREFTRDQWQELSNYAYTKAHTMTASHDDTLSLLRAGNSESYVKVVYPEKGSQVETIEAVEAAGYAWVDVTREVFGGTKPPPEIKPPPPSGETIDLAQYITPAGVRQYIIKNQDGQQEKYRPQAYAQGHLIQKNGQGEYYEVDDTFINLVWDTTPNADQYYIRTVSQSNSWRTPYTKRFMKVGESWTHNQSHYVTFYRKDNCDNANSPYEGTATQSATLEMKMDSFTTKYGATFQDVIILNTGHERQYYAKDIGRIGWIMEVNNGEAWATNEDISNQEPHPLQITTCLTG